MILAFTGHRPEHLPWRTDETDARCAALKAVLQREVSALYQRMRVSLRDGARVRPVFCGSGGLWDAGNCRCESDRDAPLPQSGRALGRKDAGSLPADPRAERRGPRAGGEYSPGCMLRRNRAMVDAADVLLTVFDGSEGGTAATIRYAKKARHGDRAGVALKFHLRGTSGQSRPPLHNATAAIRRAL